MLAGPMQDIHEEIRKDNLEKAKQDAMQAKFRSQFSFGLPDLSLMEEDCKEPIKRSTTLLDGSPKETLNKKQDSRSNSKLSEETVPTPTRKNGFTPFEVDQAGFRSFEPERVKVFRPALERKSSVKASLDLNKSKLSSIKQSLSRTEQLTIHGYLSSYDRLNKKQSISTFKCKTLDSEVDKETRKFMKLVGDDHGKRKLLDAKHFDAASCAGFTCKLKPDARTGYTLSVQSFGSSFDILMFGGMGMRVYNDAHQFDPKNGKEPWTELQLKSATGRFVPRLQGHTMNKVSPTCLLIYGGVYQTAQQVYDTNPCIYKLDPSSRPSLQPP